MELFITFSLSFWNVKLGIMRYLSVNRTLKLFSAAHRLCWELRGRGWVQGARSSLDSLRTVKHLYVSTKSVKRKGCMEGGGGNIQAYIYGAFNVFLKNWDVLYFYIALKQGTIRFAGGKNMFNLFYFLSFKNVITPVSCFFSKSSN